MTKALVRTPETFFTAFSGARDTTLPAHLGQLKMAPPKPNGRRLCVSICLTSDCPQLLRSSQGGFPDDAKENTMENDEAVNIWWDFGRCPLPSNFDAGKIGSNITTALRRINNICGGSIYFRAYGNLEKKGEDMKRFISESGFQLMGFKLRENECHCPDPLRCYPRSDNVMIDDLNRELWHRSRPGIHAVISDGKDTYRVLDSLREKYKIIPIFPERQIEQIAEEVWPLESFWA